MKRLMLAVATVLFLAAPSFAADNVPTTGTWNKNINVSKLSQYLKLEASQKEEVENITTYFSNQMSKATRAKKDQNKKLHDAVYSNLKLMKQTLTPEQYSKYIMLLNITLKNRGIELK